MSCHYLDKANKLYHYKLNWIIRQYYKNLGRDVKLTLEDGKSMIGILDDVVDEDSAILFFEQLKAPDKGRKAKHASEAQKIEIKNILKINVILIF